MTEQVKIKIVQTDGSIAVMSVVLNDDYGIQKVYSPELIEEQIKKAELPCASWERIDDAALPERTYRNAWCDAGPGKIGHDMPKARDLHRDMLRSERAPRLLALDVEMSKAYKDQTKQDQIESQRQKLRDAPAHPSIDQALTVEDLNHLTLDTLIQ